MGKYEVSKESSKRAFKNEDERVLGILDEMKRRVEDGTIEDLIVVGFNRVNELTILTTLPSESLLKELLGEVAKL